MTTELYTWIYSLVSCGCLSSIVLFLYPESRSKGLVETGCTCVLIIALLMPLISNDIAKYESSFDDFYDEIDETRMRLDDSRLNFNKYLIESELDEYVLNEANALGVNLLSVTVRTHEDEYGVMVPYEIEYESLAPIPNSFLIQMETDLGVATERQKVYEVTGDNQKVYAPQGE